MLRNRLVIHRPYAGILLFMLRNRLVIHRPYAGKILLFMLRNRLVIHTSLARIVALSILAEHWGFPAGETRIHYIIQLIMGTLHLVAEFYLFSRKKNFLSGLVPDIIF